MARTERFSMPSRESQDWGQKAIDEEMAGRQEEKEQKEYGRDEVIPEGLTNTYDFFEDQGEEVADRVYDWYQKAMRRRQREPLSKEGFVNHFFRTGSLDPTYMFGDKRRGYLLGFSRQGAFIPTHFAPRGLRGGHDLLEELGGSKDIPVVMAITDDLAEMIKRMPGWQVPGYNFTSSFRGQPVEKQIAHNNFRNINEILARIAEELINEGYGGNRDFDQADSSDYEDYEEAA